MLGADRFSFETPNVIDPGDLPPSQPARVEQPMNPVDPESSRSGSGPDSYGSNGTHYKDHVEDDVASRGSTQTLPISNSYRDERSARLLRDISDLELTPPAEPYDPYRSAQEEPNDQDEDDMEEGTSRHHSLPSVDDARMYAASLLQDSKRRGDHNFQRTVKLRMPRLKGSMKTTESNGENPHRHVLRRQFMRHVRRLCGVAIVMAVIVGTAVAIGNRRGGAQAPSSTVPEDTGSSKPGMRTPISGVDTKQRKEEIMSFLIEQRVTSHFDLEDPESPQSQAVDWLAQYDLLLLPVPSALHTHQRFVQRYVLATFFYALSGHEWANDYKFLSSEDECGWFEDIPTSDYSIQDRAFGVTCTPQLTVQSLFVPANNLKGSLPSELRFLSTLDMIALPNNAIRGTIPREFHAWSNLVYMDFKYNRISGMLPAWIGDLSNLQVLGLSNNQFAGNVPANFGSLARLKTLALDDNALNGDMDWANHLTNLRFLYAERNMFTGRVDDNFLSSLQMLEELDLSSTALTGTDLPLHLLAHPRLQVLDLSHNEIGGSLPEIPDENRVLKYLSLSNCKLNGTIPQSIRQMQGLDHLDLTGNSFGGTIPNIIGQMTNLKFLFLGKNSFEAGEELPPLLSQLTQLRELALDSANIGGPIPSWLSFLEFLKLLNLSSNRFSGTVPQKVWNLPNLSFLLLHDNQLSGEIPSGFQNSDEMEVLTLFKNSFAGDVSNVCNANTDFGLVAPDCSVTCNPPCCEQCCEAGDDDCFAAEVPSHLSGFEGMWEYGFDRASYSFDPAILEETNVITTQGEEDEGDFYVAPPENMVGDNFYFPGQEPPINELPDPIDPSATAENTTNSYYGDNSP